MPQENVDLVRRTVELFNRREIGRALETAHEDFEMDWSNSIGPLKGVYKGREAVQGLWKPPASPSKTGGRCAAWG